MGMCQSMNTLSREAEKSCQIDKQLEKEKIKQEYKILLLGSGESGKSTILKQMKIINQNGYSKEELRSWRTIVYKNLIESAQVLIQAMSDFDLSFVDTLNNTYADQIRNYRLLESQTMLDASFIEAVEHIWADQSTKFCATEKTSEFYLMDSAPYFFDEIVRIGNPNYIPNEQDVLRARLKTTGITEIKFQHKKQMAIHMFDVGGQRSERRKWIHCFEAVSSIIFCVALNEYDQVLLEEKRQNRMLESIALFESIVNSRWFLHTSIMLFLNKVDLFKIKIARVSLQKYFPDYGGGNDINKAVKYILWRFLQANRPKLNVYPHLTQATNTNNIRFVFITVEETLLQNALKASGMM
ncbi:heterotrimeric G protein alpha subunit A [Gilbertella persicaria]|uniref:heterotrimeric G protein alpha subunit A n=1 Tax=Gilbertella persicaria TaxID=101096 RepID=UPI00221F15F4|nr:heterotrimeric G protein alpha subunit A [Gilbertella persicaria]KAI8087825.1 heterotrimeric G protein alpha subunit A [Gilbertella persicaria]